MAFRTGEFECGGEEKTRSLKNGACLKKEKSTIKKKDKNLDKWGNIRNFAKISV